LPRPADWHAASTEITGYWYLDTLKEYNPPTDLDDFVKCGPPPVFISVMWNAEKFSKEILFRISDLFDGRLIVQDLHNEMDDMHSTEKLFYFKGSVPHEWLFKNVAVAIHHGGLGISMNCVRAGVPMVTIPAAGGNDHRFWAYQLSKSGVAIRLPVSHTGKQFPNKLVEAINTAMNSNGLKKNAVEMGKKIRAENGLQNAMRFILNVVPGPGSNAALASYTIEEK
jgi:UDP:flavonoid glycosyltransferase YjiC (YdhE family)